MFPAQPKVSQPLTQVTAAGDRNVSTWRRGMSDLGDSAPEALINYEC